MYTCIVKQLELVFPINVKSNTITILLDFPITYRNASVLCQSECACLHKTLNMAVFFVKSHEKRESTHAHVQSYPYNETRELYKVQSVAQCHDQHT